MAVRAERPEQGLWTYDDLLRLPDDGKRYEIIQGMLHEVAPSPLRGHQSVVFNLSLKFGPPAEKIGAMVLTAPFDVVLDADGRVVVQPDLFVVVRDRIQELGIADPDSRPAVGAPDLIVEVLSAGTSEYDRKTKREQYERAGVREYWLVSRDTQSIEVLVLRGGRYEQHLLASGDELVASTVLPDLSFPAHEVFR